MFENEYDMGTERESWNSLISAKKQDWKNQIRARQIQKFKSQIREKHNMIINYSNPEATVQKLKMAIAKQLFKLEYIINIVSNLITQFQFCTMISQNAIIEMILISIFDSGDQSQHQEMGENQQNYIIMWLNLVELTITSWSSIWTHLYEYSADILWSIIVQFPQNVQLCYKINYLFNFWSNTRGIQIKITEQDVVSLLQNKKICPVVLQIIGNNTNPIIQQTLHQSNLISSTLFYLDQQVYCNSYLVLLSKICFLDKKILQKLHEMLTNHKIQNKYLCIKILYEQMEMTDDELLKLEQIDLQCKEYIRQILEQDY